MFCSPSTMVSSRSRLTAFDEKHLRKLLVYLESYIENISPVFEKLQKHMFRKKSVYSAEIVRQALLL